MTRPPSYVIDRVAEYTVARDKESEEWEKGIAMLGLLATEDQRFIDAARLLVDRSIETQISAGQYS